MKKDKRSLYQRWFNVFLVGLLIYALGGETFHFFNHFFPGVALGVAILLILALLGKSTEQYEFSIPFLTYLYAIVPEFIAIIRSSISGSKLEHSWWENIFLFHNSLDHWLEQTELIIPITAFLLAGILYGYYLVKNKNLKKY